MASCTLAAAPAGAKVPPDRLTTDPQGDFIPDCTGTETGATGPVAMDLVGAAALVDPYGDVWLVAQTDGDPEAFIATNPELASFTWDLDDTARARHIRVTDELREGQRTLSATVDGERVPWPVDRIYDGSQVIAILTGSGIGEHDEVLWGATSYQADPTGSRCDQVGGGATPSVAIVGAPEGDPDSGETAAPNTTPRGTSTTTAAPTSPGTAAPPRTGGGGVPTALLVVGGVAAAGALVGGGAILRRRRPR